MILRSGKYKGQNWTEVQQIDPGYINWIRENRPEMLKFPKKSVNKVGDGEESEYINHYKNLPTINPTDAF